MYSSTDAFGDGSMYQSDRLKEACGVFARSTSSKLEHTPCVYEALQRLQHRGEDGSGLALYDDVLCENRIHKAYGVVSRLYDENTPELENLKTRASIGHVRYGTAGGQSFEFIQPCSDGHGKVSIAFNGQIQAEPGLSDTETLLNRFMTFLNSASDMEQAAYKLTRSQNGEAFSAVATVMGKVYAFRDASGARPLFIYSEHTEQGHEVKISSETCVFGNGSSALAEEIQPGSVIIMEKGQVIHRIETTYCKRFCAFEGMYFSREDSLYGTLSYYDLRKQFGKQLAKRSGLKKEDADVVVAVPQSGLSAALGFSQETLIPLELGLLKTRHSGRSFIKPSEAERKRCIALKLQLQKSVISNKRVVIVDDTLVRGHTMRHIVSMLKEAGALAVHVCIAAPPVCSPCTKGVDTGRETQLPASLFSIDQMCAGIGANSLSFLTREDVYHTMGDEICVACFKHKE